jgi:hypothetical protein
MNKKSIFWKKTIFEVIENEIMVLQYEYIKSVIRDIWKDNVDDYWIEITNIDLINLSDFFISFWDFQTIVKYQIPQKICYEYWDFTHLNYESERIKEFKKTLPSDCENWTLYLFYVFYTKKD